MKILLIAPSSGKWRHVGKSRLFNGRTFRFSMLSLLSVAAETPRDTEIEIIDEQLEEIPFDAEIDLVGITCMTALSPRAYEIADRFRARGVPVVLGGMHPTFCPDEALQHADAVVAGEAEGVWPEVVEAARNRSLSGVYRAKSPADLSTLKTPPYHLLKSGKYATQYAASATRGCPHGCSFCAVSAFYGGQQQKRPIESVVHEVSAIPSRFFIFVDDNLTADREYARELFSKLTPLKKKWVTQSTLAIADDEEFVKAAAKAGCVGVFVGLETFNQCNLGGVAKDFNQVSHYRDAIRLLHRHGIGVEAGIVFGFDGDGPEVFRKTLKLLDEAEVDVIQASIRTPLPGTHEFKAMQSRIKDRDWSHYDFHHAVFQPKRMTAEMLQAGHDWLTREFYSPWRIAKRLARWAKYPCGWSTFLFSAILNMAYLGRVRSWGIRGWDPSRQDATQPEIVQPVDVPSV